MLLDTTSLDQNVNYSKTLINVTQVAIHYIGDKWHIYYKKKNKGWTKYFLDWIWYQDSVHTDKIEAETRYKLIVDTKIISQYKMVK